MFWKRKKAEEAWSLSDRREEAERRGMVIEECYPGGLAAFEAHWSEDPRAAFLRLMGGLKAKDMIGYVDELVAKYWPNLPEPEKVAGVLFGNYLRLVRALEVHGIAADKLIKEDLERSGRKAEGLVKGGTKGQ